MFRTTSSDTGNPLAGAVSSAIKEARLSLNEIQQKIENGTLSTTTSPDFAAKTLLGKTAPNTSSQPISGNGALNGGLSRDQFVSQSTVSSGNWSGLGLNPETGFVPVSGFKTADPALLSMFPGVGVTENGATPPPILQLQQTLLGMLSLLSFPYLNQNPSVIAPPTAPAKPAGTTTTGGKQNAVTTLRNVMTVSETEKAKAANVNPDGDILAVSQEDVATLNQSLKTGQFSQNNLASALSDGLATDNVDALDEIAVLTGQLVDQGVLDPRLLLTEQSLQGMDEAGLSALSQGLANAGIWKSDKTVNRSLTDWLQVNLGGNTLNNPKPEQRAFAQRLTRASLNAWQGYYDTPEGLYLQNFMSTRLGLKLTLSSTDPSSLVVSPDSEQPFPLTETTDQAATV